MPDSAATDGTTDMAECADCEPRLPMPFKNADERNESRVVQYPPVKGHSIISSDRRDCRYACTCGMPLGRTRAESVRLHRAHKVNLYADGGCDHRGKYACERCGVRLVFLP